MSTHTEACLGGQTPWAETASRIGAGCGGAESLVSRQRSGCPTGRAYYLVRLGRCCLSSKLFYNHLTSPPPSAEIPSWRQKIQISQESALNLCFDFKPQQLNQMAKENKLSGWNWKTEGSCLVGCSPALKDSAKIASFDLDDTVVTRKSGAKFPKDADDWIFLNDKVSPTIKKLAEDGFKIIIFTNQLGVEKGKTNPEHIKIKVGNIAKAIGVEMQVFVATSEDQFRKPGLGMWQLFLNKYNGKVEIDKKTSFYCGDAAGRRDAKHKDFSDSDLKFALNVGIEFKTPENLFLGEKDKIEVKGFNPTTVPEEGELIVGKGSKVDFQPKEMVLMVGAPGSGKSTFCKNFLPGYIRVNRDTLKTKEKCYKVAEENILQGKSVVIDNTNPKKEDRRYFIDLAKKHGLKVRCFQMLTEKDVCFHNDYQRVANDKRNHLSGKAGSIPIHTYFKYREEPQLGEGFYEVNKVNFLAKFESDDDKEFYHKFSKK